MKIFYLSLILPLLNRLAILYFQKNSLGWTLALKQPLVGFVNDIVVVLAVLLLCINPIKSLGFAFYILAIILLMSNTAFVAFTGKNLSPYEMTYIKDALVLFDSVKVEFFKHFWALFILSLVLFVLFYLIYKEIKNNNFSLKKWFLILVVGLSFRSFTLSQRFILHEPVETNVLSYLFWRQSLDESRKIEKPIRGLENLSAYLSREKIQPSYFGRLKNQNVVFIALESFGKKDYDDHPELFPFLNELSKTRAVKNFDNHFTTVYRTIGAQFSMLCSRYDPLPFYVIRDYPRHSIECLPKTLLLNNYDVSFITGGKAHFDYNKEWFSLQGVKKLYTDEYFDQKAERFSYGTHDETVFAQAPLILDAMKEPFFSYILSISNHHPYTFPTYFTKKYKEVAQEHLGYIYTDLQLRLFFQEAAKKAWFKNTLFILVGDHPRWGAPFSGETYERYLEQYKVLSLLRHDQLPALNTKEFRNHLSLTPMILNLLGIMPSANYQGSDELLAAQDNERGSDYQVFDENKVLRYFVKNNKVLCFENKSKSLGPNQSSCSPKNTDELILFKETFYDTMQWELINSH